MRIYHASRGDTLRKIAKEYYDVQDFDGIERERLSFEFS